MTNSTNSLCLEPGCLHAASQVLWRMNPNWRNMDPCTEFDKMVCYGFNEQEADNKITLTLLDDHNSWILRNILESPSYPSASNYTAVQARGMRPRVSTDEANFDMLKMEWDACMDTDAIQAAGVSRLNEIIIKVDTIWPVNDDDLNTTITPADYDDFAQAILYLTELGVDTFEGISAQQDQVYPNISSIFILPPSFGLDNSTEYSDPAALEQYALKIAAVFAGDVYPSNISDSMAKTIAEGVVEFETELANVYIPAVSAMGEPQDYGRMHISDAAKLAPILSLDKLVSWLAPSDYKVDSVVLPSPEFLANVSVIVSQTPKAIVQSWMIWQAIQSFAPEVMSPHLDPINSGSSTAPRWSHCLQFATNTLQYILAKYYISANFNEATRKFGDEMLHNIRAQFKKRIGALSWMPDDTKKLAMEKVDNVEQFIGYPTSSPNLNDPNSIAAYYSGINITSDHLSNLISSRQWNTKYTWSLLGKTVDKGAFTHNVYDVNAYYQQQGNTVHILAGIMQAPVFSADLPSYVSYGALGAILGHELTHGFDNNGRQYDPTGTYKTWWSNDTVAKFNNLTQCFIDQYSKFSVPVPGGTQNVDGALTLPENLADAGGLHTAYDTWKSVAAGPGDKDLPGLQEFTHEQLFYIFYGNLWCNSETADANPELLADVHSPPSVRILGTTANSIGFRQAFNCPVKEPTCELW